jgi:hypothetical protein
VNNALADGKISHEEAKELLAAGHEVVVSEMCEMKRIAPFGTILPLGTGQCTTKAVCADHLAGRLACCCCPQGDALAVKDAAKEFRDEVKGLQRVSAMVWCLVVSVGPAGSSCPCH